MLLHQTGDCESGSMVKYAQKTFQSQGGLLCIKNCSVYVCNVVETLFETIE